MENQFSETDIDEITCRTINGQLAEWGIDFSQSRVAQLGHTQIEQLQSWINAGVEADEAYRAEFAALPDFMESELLEMKGELASGSREEIIEQAINACEAEVPITENPYLLDTTGWQLWRKAYCYWYHGESLDFLEEEAAIESSSEIALPQLAMTQELAELITHFTQADDSLKQLRFKLKQTKRERNASRNKLMMFLKQNCHSTEAAVTIIKHPSQAVSSPKSEQSEPVNQSSELREPISIIRIPVAGPETNRVEVFLQQIGDGTWRAGHFWSVESNSQTGQISRGSQSPERRQTTFSTDTSALINETLILSRKLSSDPEIQTQIVDYLNLLEEYPGQLDLCSNCHQHWLSEELDLSGCCPQCSND
ncbi:hypothetical protein [Gimesia algae]|uniref:Uncharacterized protein n=1 Tax=Gimesia algae TaxID=2527971 RepID=A0A517VMW0_9PLAN|nr:hypothetical protein [Gimesia algae]QDT94344.1 hypothetical protein Pan161_60400 [Gimesia algae]